MTDEIQEQIIRLRDRKRPRGHTFEAACADTIESLLAENDRLKAERDQLRIERDATADLAIKDQAENERLKARFDFKGALTDTVANQQKRIERLEAKVEAYKRYRERNRQLERVLEAAGHFVNQGAAGDPVLLVQAIAAAEGGDD